MKKLFLAFLIVLAGMAGTALAHPPTEITLSYDKGTKTLHVDVKHISDKLRKHHIRRVTVYRNDEEAETRDYHTQKPPGMDDDFVVETKPGDILRAEAVCSEGGDREESLTVPEDAPAEKPAEKPTEKPAETQAGK